MKRIYKYLMISTIIATFGVACSDYLDIPPANERAVASVEDVKSVLAGYLYETQSPSSFNFSPMPFLKGLVPPKARAMFEAYSDNIDSEGALPTYLDVNARFHPIYNRAEIEKTYANLFLFNEFDVPGQIWKEYYESIGLMNGLLYELDNLQGDPSEKDIVMGEILTHRAYYHFKLLQYFAPMDNGSMGIPVFLNTGENVVGVKPERKSHQEVYDVILADLIAALEMVNRTAPQEDYNLFYSERSINHLLAQVYWYKAESPAKSVSDYDNAVTHAEEAIIESAELVPQNTTDFTTSRAGTNGTYPSINLKSGFNAPLAYIYGSQYFYFTNYGLTVAPVSISLDPAIPPMFIDTDIRKPVLLNPSNALGDRFPNTRKDNIYQLFQPEEPYLILAEAHYKLGDEGSAIQVLNRFKSFRNSGDATGLSGNDLFMEIRKERRIEFLAQNEYRWIALKRYADVTHSRSLEFFGTTHDIIVAPNSYHYSLPIPLQELQENPNMVQNPGWVQQQF